MNHVLKIDQNEHIIYSGRDRLKLIVHGFRNALPVTSVTSLLSILFQDIETRR